MANHGDFSSLLQLGVGLGIGISVFRAPVDIRIQRLQRDIEDELSALRGVVSDFARAKRRTFFDLRLELERLRDGLEKVLRPCILAAIFGAVANIGLLAFVSFRSSENATDCYTYIYTYISVFHYAIIMCALEAIARVKISSFSTRVRTEKTKSL